MISQILANTNFKKNKQPILGYLFLIYYVVYAVSPLSYTYTVKRIVEGISTANGTSGPQKRLNIFLLELICSKLDSKKDLDQNNATDRVLIRKSRAILPESASVKLTPSENLLFLGHIMPFFDNSSSRLLVSSDEGNSSLRVNPLHSGPAPPSA